MADLQALVRQQHHREDGDGDEALVQLPGFRELTTEVRMLPPVAMGKGALTKASILASGPGRGGLVQLVSYWYDKHSKWLSG